MSPWGTPRSRLIFSFRCPPIMMQASLPQKKSLIQSRMYLPNSSVLKTDSIKEWSMESKAFLKSINKMRASFFTLFAWFIMFIRLTMQLPMLFLLIQAFCCFPTIDSIACFILWVIAQLASSQQILKRLMGLSVQGLLGPS